MTLDKILKPVKFVDEQILRQYTKLTKKWEDKGKNKYTLAIMFNAPAWVLPIRIGLPGNFMFGILMGSDMGKNIMGVMNPHRLEDYNHNSEIAKNPKTVISDGMRNIRRLPFFTIGSVYLVKSRIHFYDYFFHNEPTLPSAINNLTTGLGFICVSSSEYIKSSDPKILEKKPFYETLFGKIKDKLSSLVPSPLPVPVKASLEYRVD